MVRTNTRRGWMTGEWMAAMALAAALGARAEPATPAAAPAPVPAGRIEAQADEVNYDRNTGWIDAKGNVVVTRGVEELRTDKARVNVNTEDVYAEGHVVLRRADKVFTADRLHYNFRTRTGDLFGLAGDASPFRLIHADRTESPERDRYVLHNANLTTCSNDVSRLHYRVTAREATVAPDDYIKGRGVVWYFGPVPVFYVPYWFRDLNGTSGFRLRPGYTSRWGAFLLSSYRYRIAEGLKGETHADYRSRRGVGLGQDFRWRTDSRRGDLRLYYADDQEPLDDDEDPATSDIDSSRYRIRLKHAEDFGPRDALYLEGNYLSDTDMLEDFFEREYRESRTPHNFANYTHRGDLYTAGALIEGRINDFFDGVNRTPELSLDLMRRPIADSYWYYESENAAAFLDRVLANSDADAADYSAGRFDTSHTMYYQPGRYFGYLNLVPRAGYRGTYYSKTVDSAVGTFVPVTVTNALGSTTQTNTVMTLTEGSAGLRSRFELGAEASVKAFRTLNTEEPYRHVAEPYLNYTLVPEPNLTPGELYQFDSVDTLDEDHGVKIGMRNKLQTKIDERPFDVIDADLYTRANIHKEEGQETIDQAFADVELRPSLWFSVDLDAQYDVGESELSQFNSWARLAPQGSWQTYLEYRYLVDDSSLLSGSLRLSPNRLWTFDVFGRYEMEDSRMEEEGGWIQRNFDCMVVKTGVGYLPGFTRTDGSDQDDEWRFLVEFYLTAFPETVVSGGDLGGWE